jgi:hypothetical protein
MNVAPTGEYAILSFSLFSRVCMGCCRGCVWGSLAAGRHHQVPSVCVHEHWVVAIHANHDHDWSAWPKVSHSHTLWRLQLDHVVWHPQLYFSQAWISDWL